MTRYRKRQFSLHGYPKSSRGYEVIRPQVQVFYNVRAHEELDPCTKNSEKTVSTALLSNISQIIQSIRTGLLHGVRKSTTAP